jgi:hypothetical protein
MARWLLLCVVIGAIGVDEAFGLPAAAFQSNYDDGFSAAFPISHKSGLASGKERGRSEGWSDGKSEGFNAGWGEAYPLAFDLAYDAEFPVGHRKGWSRGVDEGFVEGFYWVPTFVEAVMSQNSSLYSAGYRGSSTYGSVTLYSGSVTDYFPIEATIIDWAGHYYDLGYADGYDQGFSTGSNEGYNLTYPIAYAGGYSVGHSEGVDEGTVAGISAGGEAGYDDGWDEGYDYGFNAGFYAGIDYGVYGEYVLPEYYFEYSPRSSAQAFHSLVALQAPEPASLTLLLMSSAGLAAIGARWCQR